MNARPRKRKGQLRSRILAEGDASILRSPRAVARTLSLFVSYQLSIILQSPRPSG
jgi:hypothetical protein